MSKIKTSEVADYVGKEVGVSEWLQVDQARINSFAGCTEDHQFIHLDEEAASKTMFGGTIAHGFLSLLLLPKLAETTALVFENTAMGINYGFEKIRFLTPVRSGRNIRARFTLKEAVERYPRQWLLTYNVAVEIEGEEKPALIAEWLTMQVVSEDKE